MKRILLLATLITAGFAAAEERKDGVSPSGKIAWHVVQAGDNGASEVFISEADQGESAAQKLCETVSVANTKVFVSPDDSWIIVQTGGASLGTSLIALRRENGMIYQEDKETDIGAAVLLAACDGDQTKVDAIERVHTTWVGWSGDSKSLLVEVEAHGGEKTVRSFFAIYDLTTRKIGFDLAKFNQAGKANP